MCEQVRETLSAQLDGEVGPIPTDVAEAHLGDCAECRAWQADVVRLQRRARVSAAPVLSDETERFVAAVNDRRQRDARHRRRLLPIQLGLVAVAVTQLVVAGPSLLLGRDAAAPEHVAHELGAFTVALAAGWVLAALRPRLANGMVPIVGIVAGLLVITAWIDAVLGHTDIVREWPHLLEVAGFVLLLRLAYRSNDGDWTPLLLPLRSAYGGRLGGTTSYSRSVTQLPPPVPAASLAVRRRASGE